ncbi:MAG: NCS2 family permease [Halobacteriota archaeon]|nr:NCS2 family permease [Halobacteriota archaeon]
MRDIGDLFSANKEDFELRTEVIAGVTTFLATMYIIIVNPAILSDAGMPFSGVLVATVIVSAFSSIMMGLYAKNPIVLAPGMGLNAFFTYSVVLSGLATWEVALGAVFWSGIIFLILSVLNIRTMIVKAIPKQIRYGVAAGIGLFITFIGLMNAGFIIDNPATLISMAELNPANITFVIGLMITAILVVKRVRGALILGIAITTILSIPLGRLWGDPQTILVTLPVEGIVQMPDFSLILALDLIGSFKLAMLPVIFAFLFTDMFDSLSTFVGVAEAGDLLDEEGEPLNVGRSLQVDAISTTISGLLGTSAGTSYIESATGIEEGGRTGLTAVVAGLLFLPFIFFSPLLSIVPAIATAPALVLVGAFMMKPVLKIDWGNLEDAIPAFLSMILIPLTYSITQGIIWGFLSWTLIKIASGKLREIPMMLYVIDLFAILALIV